jgi:putative membrane protein
MHRGFNNLDACFSGFTRFGYGGFIMMGIGLILILVLVYIIFKKGGLGQIGSNDFESPLDLLQKRYVNGDISNEEYQEKKDILKKK